MSRGLKILARELEVPVLAISQLSRAPEQRSPPKPMLSDLRESGNLEQDADLVAFLYREDYYRDHEDEPDGLADVIVAKHRNGPIGSQKLVFLDRFPKFADHSGRHEPVEQPAGVEPPMEDAGGGARVLMAIARSEPFREQACPLGVCDGSGWILGPEDVARPCECRESRLRRDVRGIASVIPPRYRGVSFDRPPVSDMERDLGREVVGAVQEYVADLDAAGGRKRAVADGGHRDGQDDPGMLVAKTALSAGKTVAVYFTAEAPHPDPPDLPGLRARGPYDAFFKRLTSVDLLYIDDLGSERRSDWVSSSSTRWSTSATRPSVRCSSPATRHRRRQGRELAEQIGAAPSPAWSRCATSPAAALRSRTSATGACGRRVNPAQSPGHARLGHSRRPVGRRGQGQGHRPARRPHRRDRPLPGRQQRRPHDRPRRRDLQVPPDPVRDPALGQDLRDRQRGRPRPAHPARGDRRPAPSRRRRRQPEDLGQRPPDHALPRAARHGRRAEARQALAGDDAARDRPLLRRQGAAARHPRPGPARREDPAGQDPHGAGAQAAGAARTLGAAAQAAQGGGRGGRSGAASRRSRTPPTPASTCTR